MPFLVLFQKISKSAKTAILPLFFIFSKILKILKKISKVPKQLFLRFFQFFKKFDFFLKQGQKPKIAKFKILANIWSKMQVLDFYGTKPM